MRRASKSFYLISIFAAPFLGGAIIAGAVLLINPGLFKKDEPHILILLPALAVFLYSWVIYFQLIYKAWASIQDGQARTTPGKAVGFLFIPFFNLYWIFQVFHGFAVDYNRFAAKRTLPFKASEGLFLAFPILLLVEFLPLVGILALLPSLVVMVLVILQMCDAINAVSAPPGDPKLRAAMDTGPIP